MFSVLSRFAQSMSDMNMSYDTSYSTSTNSATGAIFGFGVIIAIIIIILVSYLFFGFCLMKIFKKAGRQDAWAGFVPFYNMYVYFEIAGRPGWWVFLGLIPLVGGIISVITSILGSIDLAKSFGKEVGFGILLAILPIIGYPMLAFGGAQYQGPAGSEGQNRGQLPPQAPIQPPTPPQPPVSPQPPTPPQPPVVQ